MNTLQKPLTLPLAERAMQLEISVSMFGNSKQDKTGLAELKKIHHAKDGRSGVSKKLLAPDTLATGVAIQQKLRTLVYANTIPYDHNGRYLVPTGRWFNFLSGKVRELDTEFWEWVDYTFVPQFQNYVDQARIDLNGAFDDRDYPHPSKIRNAFGFGVHTALLPDYSNLTDTQKTLFGADELAKMESQLQERIDLAVSSLYSRMANVLLNPDDQNNPGVIARLKSFQNRVDMKDQGIQVGKKGFFKDSLIENVKDLIDSIPELNITDDPSVAAFASRIESEICSITPETLRSDSNSRAQVIASAEDILEKMSYYQ